MNNNLKGHNWGHRCSSEQAEKTLKDIGFFEDEVNIESFLAGDIEVFSEPWECAVTVILCKKTNETIFFNQKL